MAHEWTLFTNHGAVLLCIAENGDATMRAIADCVGITERATQRIVKDLCERGYITRVRSGRRNTYALHPELPISEPAMRDHPLGELLAVARPPTIAAALAPLRG